MTSATESDTGKPCELLLVGNARALPEMEHLGALVAEVLGRPPTVAMGAFDQMGAMMRRLGVHEMSIRETERIIGVVMARALVGGDDLSTIARVARKVSAVRHDPTKAAFCLLPPGSSVRGERAVHIFSSPNLNIGVEGQDPDGVYAVKLACDRSSALPEAPIPNPSQIVVLSAPVSRQPYAPVSFAIDFFHEASHMETTSRLYDWVMRNAEIIKAGRGFGLAAQVVYSGEGFQIQQGFAQVLLESQAELVQVEMMAMLGYPDRARTLERTAKRLIRDLSRIKPARDFLRKEGLNASNILDWSQTMVLLLMSSTQSGPR